MVPSILEVGTFVMPVVVRITKLPATPRFTGAGSVMTATVTVYVCVVASAACTVYVTGLVKLFGVVVLVCVVVPTVTNAPDVENVATRAVTLGVLNGMVTVIAVPIIVLVSWPASEYAVMALAKLGATVTVTV
jgi:hypothetical protein